MPTCDTISITGPSIAYGNTNGFNVSVSFTTRLLFSNRALQTLIYFYLQANPGMTLAQVNLVTVLAGAVSPFYCAVRGSGLTGTAVVVPKFSTGTSFNCPLPALQAGAFTLFVGKLYR